MFFVSGIYTYYRKTLLYLLAFCVINIIQIIFSVDYIPIYHRISSISKSDTTIKLFDEEFQMKSIVVAIILIELFFVILYIILIIMMWKNGYWNVISRAKIRPNDKIKKSYIMYKSFNFLLYITLHTIATLHLIVIYTDYYELGFFVMYDGMYDVNYLLILLTISLTIIKRELKFSVFLIYIALIVQSLSFLYCYFYYLFDDYYIINEFKMANRYKISIIIGLMLLVLTFINTILCHLNFGKSHILLLKFNPNLDKDYEYSDDLDDNDDDDEEEEEKDEKISEKLTRYWKFIKESFNSLV
ncbi:unnamed protein product [Rhizophagus irregularis]|nr:unnamed protein product [Rhizophagus irregularis]